jgi:hypothetical protein
MANNAADGSTVDANANVTQKNIATLEAEINKDINIQINRSLCAGKSSNSTARKPLTNTFARSKNTKSMFTMRRP